MLWQQIAIALVIPLSSGLWVCLKQGLLACIDKPKWIAFYNSSKLLMAGRSYPCLMFDVYNVLQLTTCW